MFTLVMKSSATLQPVDQQETYFNYRIMSMWYMVTSETMIFMKNLSRICCTIYCEYFDQNWYASRFQMHLEPKTLVVGYCYPKNRL